MPELLCVGEILVEMMAEEKGQPFSRPGRFLGPYPSGAPAIFADQAARLGVSCGLISRVGRDPFGELCLKRLREDGVDVSHVSVDEDRLTGIAFVTYDTAGGREFLYHFRHAAIGAISSEEVEESAFAGARWLHLMGCTLQASPQIARAALRGAEIAAKLGLTLSFDPNIRPELLRDGETREIFERILHQAAFVLTGAGELLHLTGCASVEEGAETLLETAQAVVVKNGSRETLVFSRGEAPSACAPFPSEEVDPTGAGDCFDGAFVAGLLRGRTLREAVRMGCAAGALAVRRRGPMEGAAAGQELQALLGAAAGS